MAESPSSNWAANGGYQNDYALALSSYFKWEQSLDTIMMISSDNRAEYIRQSRLNERIIALNNNSEREGGLSADEEEILRDTSNRAAVSELFYFGRVIRCPREIWNLWTYIKGHNDQDRGITDEESDVFPNNEYQEYAPVMFTRSIKKSDAKSLAVPEHVSCDALLGLNVSLPQEFVDCFDHVFALRWDDRTYTMRADILSEDKFYRQFGGVSAEVSCNTPSASSINNAVPEV